MKAREAMDECNRPKLSLRQDRVTRDRFPARCKHISASDKGEINAQTCLRRRLGGRLWRDAAIRAKPAGRISRKTGKRHVTGARAGCCAALDRASRHPAVATSTAASGRAFTTSTAGGGAATSASATAAPASAAAG